MNQNGQNRYQPYPTTGNNNQTNNAYTGNNGYNNGPNNNIQGSGGGSMPPLSYNWSSFNCNFLDPSTGTIRECPVCKLEIPAKVSSKGTIYWKCINKDCNATIFGKQPNSVYGQYQRLKNNGIQVTNHIPMQRNQEDNQYNIPMNTPNYSQQQHEPVQQPQQQPSEVVLLLRKILLEIQSLRNNEFLLLSNMKSMIENNFQPLDNGMDDENDPLDN